MSTPRSNPIWLTGWSQYGWLSDYDYKITEDVCTYGAQNIYYFFPNMYFQILIVFYSQSTIPDCVYKLNKLIVWATQSDFDWGEKARGNGPRSTMSKSFCSSMGDEDSKIQNPPLHGKVQVLLQNSGLFPYLIQCSYARVTFSKCSCLTMNFSEVGQIKDGCQLSSLCHPMYKNGEARSLKNSHKSSTFQFKSLFWQFEPLGTQDTHCGPPRDATNVCFDNSSYPQNESFPPKIHTP